MDIDKIINNLVHFNTWRRGDIDDIDLTPKEIGETIDGAVELLKKHKTWDWPVWYSIKKNEPPENVNLSIKMEAIGPGAPERRTWETTGKYRNGRWSMRQLQENIIRLGDEPTHWKYPGNNER